MMDTRKDAQQRGFCNASAVIGRRCAALLWAALLAVLVPAPLLAADVAPAQASYPPVLAGKALSFPHDLGAHPDYRTEWWYITGWLHDAAGEERGFQLTFFACAR